MAYSRRHARRRRAGRRNYAATRIQRMYRKKRSTRTRGGAWKGSRSLTRRFMKIRTPLSKTKIYESNVSLDPDVLYVSDYTNLIEPGQFPGDRLKNWADIMSMTMDLRITNNAVAGSDPICFHYAIVTPRGRNVDTTTVNQNFFTRIVGADDGNQAVAFGDAEIYPQDKNTMKIHSKTFWVYCHHKWRVQPYQIENWNESNTWRDSTNSFYVTVKQNIRKRVWYTQKNDTNVADVPIYICVWFEPLSNARTPAVITPCSLTTQGTITFKSNY